MRGVSIKNVVFAEQNGPALQAVQLGCIRQSQPLFAGLSFQLNPGRLLLVEGSNGSGKSSLLRLAAGLSMPDTGDILWQAKSIQHHPHLYREQLHYLGHANGLKLGLTVQENMQYTAKLHLASSQSKQSNQDKVLAYLQLSAYKKKLASHLSVGQKRRLGLAKLWLIMKPLWILDEPLTALDHDTQAFFISHLEYHLKQGGMAIISTHHPLLFKTAVSTSLRLGPC